MHCQPELDRDLQYEGVLPDATLLQWHRDRYSTSKHLLTLYSIAHGLQAKRIIEIGFGRSTFVLARAAFENAGTLESCDIEDFRGLLSETEQKVVRCHVGSSDEFWQRVEPGFDFAFLDHFSSEAQPDEWVVRELEQALTKLTPGGMLAIHDGFVAKYRLRSVVEMLRRQLGLRYECLTMPFNYGLTLWRRAQSVEDFGPDPFLKKPEIALAAQRAHPPTETRGSRPRILLIDDVPDWIFARHCHELMARLSEQFELTTLHAGEPFDEEAYDLIYPLEWNLLDATKIHDRYKYVTGIRSFTSWQHRSPSEFGTWLARTFGHVHAVSSALVQAFRQFVPDIRLLRHGVDIDHFSPTTYADQSGESIVVGWCGNKLASVKGTDTLIEPLALLPRVRVAQSNYRDGQRTRAQMPAFYDSIDVYVCASACEGHNNALLEAAAMGRAIITTDTGTVREWLRHGHSALVVEPQLDDFVAAIEHLRDHPSLRRTLGDNARSAVHAHMDWDVMAEEHARFFSHALARLPAPRATDALPFDTVASR
ncbi:MAG: glycosyltransferase [Planctomycetes bacterium]|nr:glycosyltransferase [Planctomycetota bacterium]MCB9917003.1 glycosyltransferase [Planctomycetota bacterium]